jgi:hypothetical protein
MSGGGAWQDRTTFGRGLRRMARLSDELGRAGPVPCCRPPWDELGERWADLGLRLGCGGDCWFGAFRGLASAFRERPLAGSRWFNVGRGGSGLLGSRFQARAVVCSAMVCAATCLGSFRSGWLRVGSCLARTDLSVVCRRQFAAMAPLTGFGLLEVVEVMRVGGLNPCFVVVMPCVGRQGFRGSLH